MAAQRLYAVAALGREEARREGAPATRLHLTQVSDLVRKLLLQIRAQVRALAPYLVDDRRVVAVHSPLAPEVECVQVVEGVAHDVVVGELLG